MNGDELSRLLDRAAAEAEHHAPPIDPVAALHRRRRSREQRNGHLVGLAFVLFVLLLQLVPAEALGAQQDVTVALSAVAAPRGS